MFNLLDLVTPPSGGSGIFAAIVSALAAVGVFIKSLFNKNKAKKINKK